MVEEGVISRTRKTFMNRIIISKEQERKVQYEEKITRDKVERFRKQYETWRAGK